MDSPLISILIPVYQVEPYIERCARSVFEQTYNNLEYVFVDDASPDNSIAILERVIADYPERNTHIQIIHHSCNKGLATARNTAVAACHGQFVFHVDSDDWVERDAVELLVKKQQELEADIVTGQAIKHFCEKSVPYFSGGWNLNRESLLVQLLTYKVSTTLWRRLIRKGLYTDNGIMAYEAGSGGEDYQVLPRLVYYSRQVSGVNMFIYHHNQDNVNSYSNNIQSLTVQKQGYVSVRVISDFISDKETYLQEIVRGLIVKHLFFRMRQNTSWGNKEGYEYFRSELLKTDPANWHYIKWNRPFRKYIDTRYRLFRISSFLCWPYHKSRIIARDFYKKII